MYDAVQGLISFVHVCRKEKCGGALFFGNSKKKHRGERIRTSDLLVPNQALYQAKLRPEKTERRRCTWGHLHAIRKRKLLNF